MSAIAMDLTEVGLLPARQRTPGFSDDARKIAQQQADLANGLVFGTALGRTYLDSLQSAIDAYLQASVKNWDGYNADPASILSYSHTVGLVGHLSAIYPAPHIAVDPDGELSLEWSAGRERILSISVGTDGTLTYAARFGRNRTYGTEAYLGDEIPAPIRAGLDRLFPQRPSRIRNHR